MFTRAGDFQVRHIHGMSMRTTQGGAGPPLSGRGPEGHVVVEGQGTESLVPVDRNSFAILTRQKLASCGCCCCR